VGEQLHTLFDDVTVHATKLGMLGTAEVVREVAAVLRERPCGPVICDPVMVATSGARLIDDDAVAALRTDLLPLTDLITPNVPEAAALLGIPPATTSGELPEQAAALLALGSRAVLLKGGHLGGEESIDVLVAAEGTWLIRRPKVATTATHGTGCTLSSAIAALAARSGGTDWPVLVEQARTYLQRALEGGSSLRIGSGHGPVHHFAGIWPAEEVIPGR
jgi:hydroxymethylpyrimidine/phosphomethylpyrimidine kinase